MSWENKVVWGEGLFLQPQHLQQQERYVERLVRSSTSGLVPFSYGLTRLEVDTDLLALGKFAVRSAAGLLPDGTPFSIPGDVDHPSPLDLPENCRNAVIYLVLPVRQPGAVETAPPELQETAARFAVAEHEAIDTNAGYQSVATVPIGKLRLRFALDAASRQGNVALGLVHVAEMRPDRSVVLDESYIPPILYCGVSALLTGFLAQLQGLLHHRAEALAGRVSEFATRGAGEIADYLLLQVCNRYEPLISHLVSAAGQVHPESFYRVAVSLAGELATFTESRKRPTVFPPYRHDDLHATFRPVIAALRQSLSAVLEQTAIPIPLQKQRHGILVGPITDRSLVTDATWVLVVKADVPPETLRHDFPNQAKIGPVEQIVELVRIALRGIAIRALPVVPRQLPYYAGRSYFELDRSGQDLVGIGEIGRNSDPRHRSGSWPRNRVLGDPRLGMSDDPFAEPSDNDRTIIRPRVSGVRVGQGRQPAGFAAAGDRVIRPVPKTGANPLVAAASPVLAAAVRITADPGRAPDIDNLRRAMVAAVRRFETEALATGMDTRSLRAARYALCATIDDLVTSTPWGNSPAWSAQSMTSIFHNEVTGGERFFQILEQMQQDLGHHAPVVELMYLCLSLGFSGQYRVLPRGAAAVAELREGIYRTLRQRRGEFERELSPHWQGIAAAARPLSRGAPLWAVGLGTVALAAVMFVTFTFLLADISDVAFAELFALPPHGQVSVPRQPVQAAAASMPEVRPAQGVPVASATYLRLRRFLEPEIRAGLVEVLQDPQTVTVRLTNRNMFGSGTATLASSYPPLLGRIGEALNDDPGKVMVYGYTDDQPIRTARFPSNYELSQARADAVAALLRSWLKDPARLSARGKGEADPIASNATAEGRQQNRRTEIVLLRTTDAI